MLDTYLQETKNDLFLITNTERNFRWIKLLNYKVENMYCSSY